MIVTDTTENDEESEPTVDDEPIKWDQCGKTGYIWSTHERILHPQMVETQDERLLPMKDFDTAEEVEEWGRWGGGGGGGGKQEVGNEDGDYEVEEEE